jgi:hypothetical protein
MELGISAEFGEKPEISNNILIAWKKHVEGAVDMI